MASQPVGMRSRRSSPFALTHLSSTVHRHAPNAPTALAFLQTAVAELQAQPPQYAAVATALEAVILRPYYPVSALFRLHRERDGLQVDFMGQIDGVQSYEGVRDRAEVYEIGGQRLLAASLDDIIRSKRAAGRGKDLAVIDILEKTRDEEAIAKEPGKRSLSNKKRGSKT